MQLKTSVYHERSVKLKRLPDHRFSITANKDFITGDEIQIFVHQDYLLVVEFENGTREYITNLCKAIKCPCDYKTGDLIATAYLQFRIVPFFKTVAKQVSNFQEAVKTEHSSLNTLKSLLDK